MPRRFTDVEKAHAVTLYVNEGLSLDEVAQRVGCSKTTVRDWLIKAGVTPSAIATDRNRAREQTVDATAARLAKQAAERQELRGLLSSDLTLRSAKLLARILARAEEDMELVEVARDRWRDALVVEAQAADFGPAAVKDAKRATAAAKVDVLVAEASVPSANDLSLILRRAVTDMLAIDGYESEQAEQDTDGRITVVLTAPRPDRAGTTIVQLEPEA